MFVFVCVCVFLLVVDPPVCDMRLQIMRLFFFELHTRSHHQRSLRLSVLENSFCVTVFCSLTFLITCNLRINHFINLKNFSFLTIVCLAVLFLV